MVGDAENVGTMVDVAASSGRWWPTFMEAFERVWPAVCDHLADPGGSPGFLLAAVHESRLLATCWLDPADVQGRHAVVGRHTECRLHLAGDGGVSLRHLLASTWLEDGRPHLRLLDLRTPTGLLLEDGSRSAGGLSTDGSALARLGDWTLLCLRRGVEPWPDDAAVAWSSIPTRECVAVPSAPPRVRIRSQLRLLTSRTSDGPDSTLVMSLDPALELSDMVPGPREALGVLHLPGGRCCRIRADALDRGVLVGRNDRCAVTTDELGGPGGQVSRVHLALVRDPTGLWAIDTASTNGTRSGEMFAGAFSMRRTLPLVMGGQLAIRWVPLA